MSQGIFAGLRTSEYVICEASTLGVFSFVHTSLLLVALMAVMMLPKLINKKPGEAWMILKRPRSCVVSLKFLVNLNGGSSCTRSSSEALEFPIDPSIAVAHQVLV